MDLTPHLHPQIDLFGHFQTVSHAIIDLCPAWVDGTIHTAHLRSREVKTYFEVIRCPTPHSSLFRAKSTWLDVQLYKHTSLVYSISKAWRLSLINELLSKGWDGYDHNPDHCCHVQVGEHLDIMWKFYWFQHLFVPSGVRQSTPRVSYVSFLDIWMVSWSSRNIFLKVCFVRLVAFSLSSAACLSSSWSQYVHRRETSSSAERWKFSMHLHINTPI